MIRISGSFQTLTTASFMNSDHPQRPRQLTLIGMPGSGKSTLGKALAAKWQWAFVDVDQVIVAKEGRSLAALQDELGRDGFLDREAWHIQQFGQPGEILAPGGSVIYRSATMQHLRQCGLVVYLHVPLKDIELRIGDLRQRGVVIAPGKTVGDLWHERHPLYEQAAHLRVPCSGTDPTLSLNLLEQAIRQHMTSATEAAHGS